MSVSSSTCRAVYNTTIATCISINRISIITFFTSRTEEHREITEEWLKKHDFNYHGLLMNKPRGGNYHWIDNHIVRATRFKGKFTDLVVENRDVEVFRD